MAQKTAAPCVSISQESDKERVQAHLTELAEEISAELSTLEPEQSRELLSDFVSDLFLAAADQKRREDRRRKQAEGIAAAKARGVRFGRTEKPVPENFDQLHRAWRDGEMSLQEAARACGIARGTFQSIALRREQAGDRAV